MHKFSWTSVEIGISLGVIGLATAVVQGVLIRWINPKLGQDRSIYLVWVFMRQGSCCLPLQPRVG